MSQRKSISDIRREYGQLSLSIENVDDCPFTQFDHWFSEVSKVEKHDPTAMLLSTVDQTGHPDSRVVLLKAILDGAFIFYTNYNSTKSIQIGGNPHVALNFYWPEMARQVRVRGQASRVSSELSDDYFNSRPKPSQLSAITSKQSHVISGRNELEQKLNEVIALYEKKPIVRPDYWGGYQVVPEEFEFWQGRDNRLHDRVQYYRHRDEWLHRCLAP